jgi:chromosome partitioning protein
VPPDATPTIAEVLTGRAPAAEAVHDGIVPANLQLAEAELALAGKMGRELTLRKVLRGVDDDVDVVLLDCPPNLGLLTVNALVAASHALIACEAQYFALQGVQGALDVIEQAREYYNDDLEFLGAVVTKADLRTVHSREAVVALREAHPGKIFDSVIRSSIAYAESAERGVSILDHRPTLGVDYLDLAGELASALGETSAKRKLTALAKAARA